MHCTCKEDMKCIQRKQAKKKPGGESILLIMNHLHSPWEHSCILTHKWLLPSKKLNIDRLFQCSAITKHPVPKLDLICNLQQRFLSGDERSIFFSFYLLFIYLFMHLFILLSGVSKKRCNAIKHVKEKCLKSARGDCRLGLLINTRLSSCFRRVILVEMASAEKSSSCGW